MLARARTNSAPVKLAPATMNGSVLQATVASRRDEQLTIKFADSAMVPIPFGAGLARKSLRREE